MNSKQALTILASIVSFVGLLIILSLLASKVIRYELTNVARLHEVTCKVDIGKEAQECHKLAQLSDKLTNLTETMSAKEVTYCALTRVLKLGIIERKCSTFDSAKELHNEIRIIMEATGTMKDDSL